MKCKKAADYHKNLLDILQINPVDKQNQPLRDLAKAVGAHQPAESGVVFREQIVNNINHALQTLTNIEMHKTTVINFWISVVSVAAAILSGSAAWVAIFIR